VSVIRDRYRLAPFLAGSGAKLRRAFDREAHLRSADIASVGAALPQSVAKAGATGG